MKRLSAADFMKLAGTGSGAALALLAGCGAPATRGTARRRLPLRCSTRRATTAQSPAPGASSGPSAGQLIHAYTQEAVQFNPLSYVNTAGVRDGCATGGFQHLVGSRRQGQFHTGPRH